MEGLLNIISPRNKSSYIKVIGIGGGGNNAVNHMYEQGIQGVDFYVCNTDAQALSGSPVPNQIQLGEGLGAGNIPAVAEEAALEKADEIKEEFAVNTKMVFITAGMGGGTGTGAAPVIAKLLKEIELEDNHVNRILTVAVVTTPFEFEGPIRIKQAEEGISELRKHVDAILIINNDKLKEFGEFKMTAAFAKANEVLNTAVKGISEIMTVRSRVQIDFHDVNTVIQNSGQVLMGCGSAEGKDRAISAVKQAIESPLLNDSNINGAKKVLIYISSSSENEVTISEFGEIANFVKKATGMDANVIWGAGFDDSLGEKVSVTLIVAGFSESEIYKKPTRKATSNIQTSNPSTSFDEQSPAPLVIGIDDEWDPTQISQNMTRSAEEKTDARSVNTECSQSDSTDRVEHLRSLSAMVKTLEGLEEIERVPAYVRRQVELTDPES